MYQEFIAIFYFVKIKNSKDTFGSLKCKVTFGFKYTLIKLKMGHETQPIPNNMICVLYQNIQFCKQVTEQIWLDSFQRLIGADSIIDG